MFFDMYLVYFPYVSYIFPIYSLFFITSRVILGGYLETPIWPPRDKGTFLLLTSLRSAQETKVLCTSVTYKRLSTKKTTKFEQILTIYVKNHQMHVENFQGRHFLRKRSPCGNANTSHRG